MARERAIVVGAGSISRQWFTVLAAEHVRVLAVVDLEVARAQQRVAEAGLEVEVSDNLGAMLEKHQPDFVVDLTVPESHAQVTCAALRAGCHVIGEKPMAASLAEGRRMVRTAEETGRLYMVSQSRRWYAHHEVLQRLVARGSLGAVATVNCDYYLAPHFGGFRDEMSSPLILDMAIHHFDLARYLTGTDPVAVYALEYNPRGSWYQGAASATCVFEMTEGVVFTYRGSWCGEGCGTSWNGHWRIAGDRGTALCENDELPWGEVVAGGHGSWRSLKALRVPAPRLRWGQMHGALREMLAFLRRGTVPQTECHDNLKSLAMVFAAIESSRRGKRIPVTA